MRKKFNQLGLSATIWLGYWIIETIYFLVVEGWHVKATSEAEIACDVIERILMLITVFMIGRVHWALMENYIKRHEH